MELTYSNQFVDITDSTEIYDVNGGGITLGTAILVVGICVGGCAVVGFVGGCVYELIFG